MIGFVIMSALICLWVATTQFLKATFTPRSPVFFTFNGSRIQMLDKYIIADKKESSSSYTLSSGDQPSVSDTSVDEIHLSTLSR